MAKRKKQSIEEELQTLKEESYRLRCILKPHMAKGLHLNYSEDKLDEIVRLDFFMNSIIDRLETDELTERLKKMIKDHLG
jgi:hypothetical protein